MSSRILYRLFRMKPDPPAPAQSNAAQSNAALSNDDGDAADAPSFDGEPILIVDDDPSIRTMLKQTLGRAGLQVTTAEDGPDGLRQVDARDFALVLLDLKMPGMDGQAVLEEISRRRPDVPVVMITAHGGVENAVEAMRAGAANFVEKPFTIAAIRRVVRDTLRGRNGEAEPAGYDAIIGEAHRAIEGRHLGAALEHARRAVALDPLRPEAFNAMGVAAQLDMNLSKAQAYYRSALALDHRHRPAQTNLDNTSSFPRRLGQFEL